jgi:hypothetical protein
VVLAAGMWLINVVRVAVWATGDVPDLMSSDTAAVLHMAATPHSLLLLLRGESGSVGPLPPVDTNPSLSLQPLVLIWIRPFTRLIGVD